MNTSTPPRLAEVMVAAVTHRPRNYRDIDHAVVDDLVASIASGETVRLSYETLTEIFPKKKIKPIHEVGGARYHNAWSTYVCRYIEVNYLIHVHTRKVEGGIMLAPDAASLLVAYYDDIRKKLLDLNDGEEILIMYDERDPLAVEKAIQNARISTYNGVGLRVRLRKVKGGRSICRIN